MSAAGRCSSSFQEVRYTGAAVVLAAVMETSMSADALSAERAVACWGDTDTVVPMRPAVELRAATGLGAARVPFVLACEAEADAAVTASPAVDVAVSSARDCGSGVTARLFRPNRRRRGVAADRRRPLLSAAFESEPVACFVGGDGVTSDARRRLVRAAEVDGAVAAAAARRAAAVRWDSASFIIRDAWYARMISRAL